MQINGPEVVYAFVAIFGGTFAVTQLRGEARRPAPYDWEGEEW